MTGLAEVIGILDVERLDFDLFRGEHPEARPPRVFGGQVLSQALRAAGRTAPESRMPHSLHGYFIRPGVTTSPIVYKVTSLRDGGSLSVRRVSAVQAGHVIFEMTASFSEEHAPLATTPAGPPAPPTSEPEDLLSVGERLAAYAGELDGWWVRDRPFDLRPLGPTPREALDQAQAPVGASQLWMRADGPVPEDRLLHACLLAYVSDMTLLEPVLIAHRRTTLGPGSVASLDHAMWFHEIPDVTQWLLYDKHMLGGSARRGLAGGRLFTRAGDLVGTVNQEGYLSPHAPRNWAGPRLAGSAIPTSSAPSP